MWYRSYCCSHATYRGRHFLNDSWKKLNCTGHKQCSLGLENFLEGLLNPQLSMHSVFAFHHRPGG